MKALMLVAWAAALAGLAASPAQDGTNDMKQLQGRWASVGAFSAEGKVEPVKEEDPRYFTFEFGPDKLTTRLKKHTIEGKYRIDPAKDPKEIDIVRRRGEEELTFKGIYAIDGDRLKVCLAGAGNERPKKFQAGKGIEFAVELKRLKD